MAPSWDVEAERVAAFVERARAGDVLLVEARNRWRGFAVLMSKRHGLARANHGVVVVPGSRKVMLLGPNPPVLFMETWRARGWAFVILERV